MYKRFYFFVKYGKITQYEIFRRKKYGDFGSDILACAWFFNAS